MENVLAKLSFFLCLLAGVAVASPGDTQSLGENTWGSANSMVVLDGKIYIATDGGLRVVDKRGRGKWLSPKGLADWRRVRKLAVLNGKIYCTNEETLYELAPNGNARRLTDDWTAVPGMAALDGKLYIVSSDDLYEVEPSTGEYKILTGRWYSVAGMVELNGKLYIINQDKLFEVDKSGIAREFKGVWNSASGMAAANGKLYIVTHQSTRDKPGARRLNEYVLDSFDPKSETRTRLPIPQSWAEDGIGKIAVHDGKLYANMKGSTFYSLALN